VSAYDPAMKNSRSERSRRLQCGLVVVSLGLIGSACGGDDALTGADGRVNVEADAAEPGAAEAETAEANTSETVEGMNLQGITTIDSLIPELAGLPVPDGAVFGLGVAYDEDQDPRQTAIQTVFFTLPVEEVAAFYLEQLPLAGYEITNGEIPEMSDIAAAQYAAIEFDDPTGIPGQVVVKMTAVSPSQIDINLFRSGVR